MASGDGISGNRTIPNVGTNGLGGDSWVVLLDTQGQKIREWAYPGYLFGLTVLGDGGILFVEGLSVVRMDGDGTILWRRGLQLESKSGFYSLALLADGGFVCSGFTTVTNNVNPIDVLPPTTSRAALLARFDKDGNTLWHQIYDYEGEPEIRKVLVTEDGGFLLGMQTLGVHVVEASTNLVDWFGVSTNRLGVCGTIVSDPTSTNQVRRFYRARALDPQ